MAMAAISANCREMESNCTHQSRNNEPFVEPSFHSSPLTVSPLPSPATCSTSSSDPTLQNEAGRVDDDDDDASQPQVIFDGHEEVASLQERCKCNAGQIEPLPTSMNLQSSHPAILDHHLKQQLELQQGYVCGPSLVLDPNAPEFTPVFAAPILYFQPPILMAHPVFSAPQSGVQVSLSFQAAVSMPPIHAGPGFEVVDSSLRLGLPTMMASGEPVEMGYGSQYVEEGNQYYGVLPEDQVAEATIIAGGYGGAGLPSMEQGMAPLTPGDPHLAAFNPPLLSNPPPHHHVGFPPIHASYPHTQPSTTSILGPSTASRHALTYRYCNYPHHVWKEHMSRSLLISGLPPDSDVTQLHKELQCWGQIRLMQARELSQGILFVHFFDVRSSRQALIDMQNQHLLRQHRFQQHLFAQNGKDMQCRLESGPEDKGCNNGGQTGLLCGHVVWAQYVSSWEPEFKNQGTLVIFNLGADVDMQELCRVFEKYGDVKEIRESPAKREYKFIEFYDTRDAEAAWAALNKQELFGKPLNIEFSHQGQSIRKPKTQSKKTMGSCMGMVTLKDDAAAMFPHPYNVQGKACGWQIGSYAVDSSACFPLPGSLPLPNTGIASEVGLGSDLHRSHVGGRKGVDGARYGEITGPRRKQIGLAARTHSRGGNGQIVQPASRAMGSHQAPKCESRLSLPRGVMIRGDLHLDYDEMEVYRISGTQRTTLMVKNIPNKYSQQMLLSLLDQHCLDCNSQIMDPNEPQSAFDFVYLPIDFKNKCNLGYAFVNFTTALATLKFYKAFHAHPWQAFNSRKVCEVKYARLQGRKALEDHFKNSKFTCDTADFLPLVFVPPRNGIECPLPRVAAGLMLNTRAGRISIAGQRASMPDAQGLIPPAGQHCSSLAAQNEQPAESTFTDRDSTCSSTDDDSGLPKPVDMPNEN